ncbi:P4HA2 [Bugula neritina]|uniref:P4HA2 n=1 Tax=Bugula neritina TaxID=10212 RepID=A0A7J7J487_BUGNE|nr:P4HA2 [Bugula neritina]
MAKSSPILLLVITHAIALVNAEIFTALTTLTKALQYEKSLAGNLREYVKLEQERLQKVLELADSYERHAETALVDAESYVANPVNAYLFVKTFTTDLPKTKELVSGKQNSEEFLQLLEDYQPYLPDEEDFEGVVAAILRLQDTYQLTSQQIADGTFTPTNRSPPMSALDCFNFGAFAHKYQDHYHALIWMDEAYQRLQQESNHTVSPSSVLDYLAFACYNHLTAFNWLTMHMANRIGIICSHG